MRLHLTSVLAAILLQGSLSLSAAQELSWSSLVRANKEPRMQYVPAVIPDPADASGESWYAFTPGHLWHASDLGRTVRSVSAAGLGNLMISGFAVAHQAPHILYVGTGVNQYDVGHGLVDHPNREVTRFEGDGVYRSADRGETWTRLPFFIDAGRDLRIVSSIATSAEGDTVLVATQRRILRSLDAGQTWAVVHELPTPLIAHYPGLWGPLNAPIMSHARLYHHPRSLRHVFVTVYGAGNLHHYALASHDGGKTWGDVSVAGSPLAQTVYERASWLLAADPKNPNVFWAQVVRHPVNRRGLRERKMFRSSDGGQSWVDVPVVRKEGAGWWAGTSPAKSLHVHPMGGDSVMLGYSVGHYQDGQLITDGQQGGTSIHHLTPAPTYDRFRNVEPPQSVSQSGPYAWGISWTVNESGAARALYTGDLPKTLYIGDICTMPPPTGMDSAQRYVAARGGRGTDTGWRRQQGPGKTSQASQVTASVARGAPVPGTTTRLYPDVQFSFEHRRLHCHPDRWDVLVGGESSWGGTSDPREVYFARLEHPDSTHVLNRDQFPAAQLAASRQRPDRIWRAVPGPLDRSDDYSESWIRNLRDSTAWPYPLLREVTAVHAHDADGDVVYTNRHVSTDGGYAWIDREPPDSLQFRKRDRVVSHPEDPSVIFVCALAGLARWDEYLQHHRSLASASDYGYCRDVLVFPQAPERIWMGTDKGLFESQDAGETWSRQNRGLPNVPITRINISHDREEILVATFGRGLFVVDADEVGDIKPPPRVSVEDLARGPADMPALLPNYPNPFSGSTMMRFTTPQEAPVRLDVFDVLGRRIETVSDQRFPRGTHQVRWNSEGLSSGVYLVRMEVNGLQIGVQKMVRR